MNLYARIDLKQTNYEILPNCKKIKNPNPVVLERIYNAYCMHKKFKSVMPIFAEEYHESNNDVLGYYDNDNLVAFSLIRCYNSKNAEAVQFAWDYAKPSLRLGIKSLKNECAMYKKRGFDYFYLGDADPYKTKIEGFEICGPRTGDK